MTSKSKTIAPEQNQRLEDYIQQSKVGFLLHRNLQQTSNTDLGNLFEKTLLSLDSEQNE